MSKRIKSKPQKQSSVLALETPEAVLETIEQKNLREFVTLIVIGLGFIPKTIQPDWAINAARELLFTLLPFDKSKKELSEHDLGYLMGLTKQLKPDDVPGAPGLLNLKESIVPMGHAAATELPPAKEREFYIGYAKGLEGLTWIEPPSVFLIYFMFAFAWKEAAKQKNTTQLCAWLERNLSQNLVGSRDRISKIARKLKFPLSDKGGRPSRKPQKPH